jgi:hypothetical protein
MEAPTEMMEGTGLHREGEKQSAFLSAIIVVLPFALSACGGPGADARTGVAAPPAGSVASLPHGDHNPHHGGIVMMKGDDLHYEVVLDPSGRAYHLYFTDAVREELPAAVASAAALTIKRPGAADEPVTLRIDEAGESWVGSGQAVDNPDKTTVRVGFTIRSEPYWIDLPFRK